MKNKKEYYSEYLDGQETLLELIARVQIETIDECAEKAELTFTSGILGRKFYVNKQSILKLKEDL